MADANSEPDPFVGSELNATDLTGIKKTEETDPKSGTMRAVHLVLEGPMASRVPIARRKGRCRDEETYLRFGYRGRSLRTNIRRNDRLL